MYAQLQSWLSKLSFNYFDLIVLVGLVVGLLRGRKHGMSQELLPMLKWLIIVPAAGLLYRSVSFFLRQNIPGAFDLLWGNRVGYLVIVVGVLILFAWIKKMFGEKLIGTDMFGGAEYYLGMFGGMIRFSCIVVVILALMNSRIVTMAELAQEEKEQKASLEDIRLPTYGTIQQAMLFHSFTGRFVKQNLSPVLILSVTPDQIKPRETPAQRSADQLNQVLGVTNK